MHLQKKNDPNLKLIQIQTHLINIQRVESFGKLTEGKEEGIEIHMLL